MNLKLIGPAVLVIVLYYVMTSQFGIAGFLTLTTLILGIMMGLKYLGVEWAFPLRFKKQILLYGSLGLILVGLFTGGYLSISKITSWTSPATFEGETVQPTPSEPAPTAAECAVTEELRGKQSTVTINAYDLEANNPYSSQVSSATTVWVFKDGTFLQKIDDVTSKDITVPAGSSLSFYGGNGSLYVDTLEGYCVNSLDASVDLDVHSVQSEGNMQVTMYDETASSTLSAGDSDQEDYYVTMGSGEEKAVYFKLKNNGANAAFHWGGLAVAEFYNISSVEPASGFSAEATPDFLSSQDIQVNETSGNKQTINKDFKLFKKNSVEKLSEWESNKIQITVESDSSNDPIASTHNINFNGFGLMALDATYARGADGEMYHDVHDHGASESNVGLTETVTSPLGKEVGALVEAR